MAIAIGIDLNTAPVGEWTLLAVSNTTVAPEGDEPHPDSGHGPYSACECPALGYVLTWRRSEWRRALAAGRGAPHGASWPAM